MPFRFEGALFGTSGIAGVNRRYWLQLQRPFFDAPGGTPRRFDLWLEPQEPPHASTFDLDVLEHLVAAGGPQGLGFWVPWWQQAGPQVFRVPWWRQVSR